MKKSKVIIPAMAMILFSTAASISGTVAWFTANRVFNTEISNFTVRALDGNLEATMLPGAGTSGDTAITGLTGEYEGIEINTNNFLVDASFDHTKGTSGVPYRLKRDTTNQYDAYSNAGTHTDWNIRTIGAYHYYVAYSWQIKFYYTFGGETNGIDIFFDVTSTMTAQADPTTNNTGSKDTGKGFRIAFLGTRNVVWGKLADETSQAASSNYTYIGEVESAAAVKQYVPASDAADGASGSEKDFIYSDTTEETKANDEATANGNAYRANKITHIDYSATKTSATVTCVAWFEGTDPNVVNDSVLKKVTANMKFYSRSSYVATVGS